MKTPARRSFVSLLSFVATTLLPFSAYAATVHVPADAPTIQDGINIAASGDTVEIACGLYWEHNIALKPGLLLRSATGMPDCVTIDAQGLGHVLTGDLVNFDWIYVDGITIVGGAADDGDSIIDPGALGGGIYLDNFGLYMTNCVIKGNRASIRGGGIYAYYSGVYLVDCTFAENEVGGAGGAMFTEGGSVHLFDCSIIDNTAGPGYAIGGGLVHAAIGPVTLDDCFIARNTSSMWAGGASLHGGHVRNCIFENNSALGAYGGALMAGSTARLTILDSIFMSNSAPEGGAIYCRNVTMDRCTVVDNQGGGIRFHDPAPSTQVISHVIVAFNQGAGLSCEGTLQHSISCTDMFGNTGGDWADCVMGQGNINGNTSTDPLFCDVAKGDYTLQANSPCAPPQSGACGQIGAFAVGCKPIHVAWKSWGAIKALYR